MLSPATVKAAAPQARAYKLFDQDGLFLHVSPSGVRSWRMKFRWRGREQLKVLGRYPEISLPVARSKRDAARELLAQGIDPRGTAEPDSPTFASIARGWHAHQLPRWSAAHAADVLATFERDVFPMIGEHPVESVSAPELLNVLRSVEQRGCGQTARRLRERLSAVFGYAIALGLAEQDPADKLGRALGAPPLARPHAALTSIEDCRALLRATDHLVASNRMIRLAHRFLALTAVRLAAVRGASWDEIEDLDGAEPLWRVPAERMKLARAKKGEARFDHLVPLSPAAVQLLREVRDLHSGNADLHDGGDANSHGLIFPGRTPGKPIGENALRSLIDQAGFADRHVPHGWRASFSTIMNEALGESWRSSIDAALAHSAKDKVEAAYNRSVQLERRREVFDRWAELLTTD